MARKAGGKAAKGSQKWLQILVNEKPEIINIEIYRKLKIKETMEINWQSPLKNDKYAEYSDKEFLKALGLENLEPVLNKFWPKRGPVWDGLATIEKTRILIEAKAHIPEIVSGSTGARTKSRRKIRQRLNETKRYLRLKSKTDWSRTFYQYSNRLAHLYFLRVLNDIDAHLVFLYFINDDEMKGPKSQAEWEGANKLLHSYLGIGRHKLSRYVHDIFIDIKELQK